MGVKDIRVGQTLWTLEKHNGIIVAVDYRNKEVYVNHYEKGREVYTFDDLLGHWDNGLNQWVISPL